jgi:hypothetical protein
VSWRRWLIILHRDVGYLCVGLTLVYAVSGVAVNHRHHWDYNYSSTVDRRQVGSPAELLGLGSATAGGPGVLARQRQRELVAALARELGRPAPPRTAFWRGRDRLSLFFDDSGRDVVDYDPQSGRAETSIKKERPFFRQINFLHLNEPRRLWTWIADLYAVALAFLAITGPLLVRGRKGLRGRGGVLVGLGLALPLLALLLLR